MRIHSAFCAEPIDWLIDTVFQSDLFRLVCYPISKALRSVFLRWLVHICTQYLRASHMQTGKIAEDSIGNIERWMYWAELYGLSVAEEEEEEKKKKEE